MRVLKAPLKTWIFVASIMSVIVLASLKTLAAGDVNLVPGTSFQDCPECPEMVVIPPGYFIMGSTDDRNEQPRQPVTINYAFAIGTFEVTIGEYQACVDDGGCEDWPHEEDHLYPHQTADHPRTYISWDFGQDYVNWLTTKTGAVYRLPTEAEWEYAARGGTSTRFWWGNSIIFGMANCSGCFGDSENRFPMPKGSLPKNPYGLESVLGNLREWVQDCYIPEYHHVPNDGSAYEETNCRFRGIRGGHRLDGIFLSRVSRRARIAPDALNNISGLRVVREIKSKNSAVQ